MPSTYSPKLGFELPAQNTQAGVWGNTTNLNFGTLIDQAIAGATVLDISVVGSPVTLVELDGTYSQARSAILRFTGTPAAAVEIVTPNLSKVYTVRNDTTQNITVKTAAQVGGVLLKPTEATIMFCDGTTVRNGIEEILQLVLPVSGGGTGVDTFTAGIVKSPGGTAPLISEPTVGLDTIEVGGNLPVSRGGLGVSVISTGSALVGNGTSPILNVTGTANGQVISWNSSLGTWQAGDATVSGVVSYAGRTGVVTPASGDLAAFNYVALNGSNASGTWNINITGSIGTGAVVPQCTFADNITVTAGRNVQGTRIVTAGAPGGAVSGNIWYQTA
jgi:hypothetical protein